MLRMVPPVGMVVPVRGSATARAILPYLPVSEQARLLGEPLSDGMRGEFAATRSRGYALNDGDIEPSAVALASAILDRQGQPVGALVLTGPAERLDRARRDEIGQKLYREAQATSEIQG